MGFQTTDDACIGRLDEWSEIGAETLNFDVGDTLLSPFVPTKVVN